MHNFLLCDTLRGLLSNFLQNFMGHDLGWVNWCMQHQEAHSTATWATIYAQQLNRNQTFFNHCIFSQRLAFKRKKVAHAQLGRRLWYGFNFSSTHRIRKEPCKKGWRAKFKVGPPKGVLIYFSMGVFKKPKWLFSQCVCTKPTLYRSGLQVIPYQPMGPA